MTAWPLIPRYCGLSISLALKFRNAHRITPISLSPSHPLPPHLSSPGHFSHYMARRPSSSLLLLLSCILQSGPLHHSLSFLYFDSEARLPLPSLNWGPQAWTLNFDYYLLQEVLTNINVNAQEMMASRWIEVTRKESLTCPWLNKVMHLCLSSCMGNFLSRGLDFSCSRTPPSLSLDSLLSLSTKSHNKSLARSLFGLNSSDMWFFWHSREFDLLKIWRIWCSFICDK